MSVASNGSWMFQHTAARRRLALPKVGCKKCARFQHTAARRRLAWLNRWPLKDSIVSTHSRPKAAGRRRLPDIRSGEVSTHSRPKAAGTATRCWQTLTACFNTQPPEGGWRPLWQTGSRFEKFQHTAARRRLGPAIL